MNTFTYGVITGISAITISVPFVAQIAGAATGTSSIDLATRSVPTQECVLAMADLEDAHLAGFDEMTAARKAALQEHTVALRAAAGIANATDLQAALDKAHEAMREAMDEAREDQTEHKELMDALKEQCGDTMLHKGMGKGRPMMMHNKGMKHGRGEFMETLGMTREELKIAIESGKNIKDIAAEKGIELPERGMFFIHGHVEPATQQ